MLSLHKIGLKSGKRIIFIDLSATFLPGSIVYLCGKNGSGKTSLFRIISSLESSQEGYVTIGKDSIEISILPKPYCTYIGHQLGIFSDLTVIENMEYWANMYDASELIPASITYFSFGDILDKVARDLSAGMQKKLSLSRLILCPSLIWLLDEVETNLDQENKMLLNNLIISHANNGGIAIISTHNAPTIKSAQILNLEEFKL